ncbi:hypothetical protein GF389_05360 [Candidatus Dojkabacteria bacterium]|nr:hypothetical protein [Candidatus Dojkabacteria bacterium]
MKIFNRKKKNKRAVKRKKSIRKNMIKKFFRNVKSSINPKTSQSSNYQTKNKADFVSLSLIAILTLFGWIMVYSASFYVASQRANTLFSAYNSFHYFILQGIWILLGSILAFIAYKLNLKYYKALIVPAYIIIFILLVIVLFMPEINGANLWIKIGPFTLQPSEFSKPVLIILLSLILSKKRTTKAKNTKTILKHYIRQRLLPFSLAVIPIVFLVIIGKDLASAALIAGISLIMLFFSEDTAINNLLTSGSTILGALAGTVFIAIEPYRLKRIETFLHFLLSGSVSDPLNTGYQLRQILIAVGTGGIFGYGFGQSRQKYYYLQETAFTDTIFAVIAEEFGLFGSTLILIAFGVLILRGIKIANQANTRFSALIALGVTIWLFLQTIIHLSVNVGLFPLTGITLPFMSYGGSSLLTCLIGGGMLLNISKEVKLD